LKDVLRWKYPGGFPEEEEHSVAMILLLTLKGLHVLHQSRVIHRDIKASNILYSDDGNILLADFGVSAILGEKEEKRKTMAGTWHWMAPEVIDPGSKGYDVQADIWSLGITSIELAYGEAPYANERPNQVVVHISTDQPPSMDAPRTPHFSRPKFSYLLADFVSCCLCLEASERHTTSQLLEHKFLTQTKEKPSELSCVLLEGLPPIESRFAKMMESINQKREDTLKKYASLGDLKCKTRNSTPLLRSVNSSRPITRNVTTGSSIK